MKYVKFTLSYCGVWSDAIDKVRHLVGLVIGLGLLYTCAVIAWAPKVADLLKVIDNPGAQDHKKHLKPTPLVGGLAAIPPAMAMLVYANSTSLASDAQAPAVSALLLAGLSSMLVGFFDDRRHIPALTRLLLCALIFGITVAIAPEITVTTLDIQGLAFRLELGVLAVPFTMLCLLAFQNAVNMADGRNGLVTGLALIWLINLLSYNPGFLLLSLIALTLSLLLVTAANIGGRLFLGDAGSYGLGAIIGLSTIWVHRQNIGLHTIDVAIMFFFPICDMFRLIVFRILSGRHPFAADHHHLHHYLDRSIGWMWGRNIYLVAAGMPVLLGRLEVITDLEGLTLTSILYSLLIATYYLRFGSRAKKEIEEGA